MELSWLERAFVITPSKGGWYSFGLQQGGDVLALVELINECSTKEAAQFLTGETVPPETRTKRQSKESAEARGGFRALEYLAEKILLLNTTNFRGDYRAILGAVDVHFV